MKNYDYAIGEYEERLVDTTMFGTMRIYLFNDTKDIYFNGVELAKFLEYKNPTNAILMVSKDYKRKVQTLVPNSYQKTVSSVINKDGIIQLIDRSRKPKVYDYKRWVYEDLTPQIISRIRR